MSSELDQLRRELEEVKRLRAEDQRRRLSAENRAISEQHRREEEQRRREEEQRRREEEQRRREEEQRRREEEQQYYEQRTGKTNLAEFLDACHVHLYQGLTVQDESQSTQGTPANADRKLRPDRIIPWDDFGAHQTPVWDAVMESDFVSERHFTSLHTLEEDGEQLHRRKLSSELDVRYFVQFAIDDRVTSIIERLSEHAVLRQSLNLRGTVKFENHGNMLSPDEVVQDLQNLTVSPSRPRRRSPRLQGRSDQSSSATRSPSPSQSQTSLPRADQFCVYSVSNEAGETTRQVPVLIIEYKAAHKLTLGHIYTGLREMDLDDIVQEHLEEDVTRRCQRLVAAVITQAFAYMIASGLEFGCVFTGEAFIFLCIPEDDCSRVYYALSVPHGDVGPTTGWTGALDVGNRLHLTAVGQLLAFTLVAIQSPRRNPRWRRDAEKLLKTWQVTVEDLEERVPEEEVPGSEYRPPQGEARRFLVESPICRRLRSRKPLTNADAPTPEESTESDEDGGGDDGTTGNGTPSRAPRDVPRGGARGGTRGGTRGRATNPGRWPTSSHRAGQQQDLGPYCSASCLKGLVERGLLDSSCPNVHQHGPGPQHPIDLKRFRQLVRDVLYDRLDYCEELWLHGARGCLYRIRLPDWGYTVVAKGTRREFIPDLQREVGIYNVLKSVQGVHIPVYLGSFDLTHPLYYMGSVPVVHMMVMSFGGRSLNHLRSLPDATTAIAGLRAIHGLGVLHRDVARRNMLWNSEEQRVIWHDFGQARIDRRSPLREKPVNHRTISAADKKKGGCHGREFSREILKALSVLKPRARCLLPEMPDSSCHKGT